MYYYVFLFQLFLSTYFTCIKMNQLCRACLVAKESFTFVLFENVAAHIYTFCTSVVVSHDDELPKTLCNTCHELLEKFSHFKNACIQSQNTLIFQNNLNLPMDNNLSEVNCEIDKSCEVVVSELKVNEANSNDGEDYVGANQKQNDYSNDFDDAILQNMYDDEDDEPLQELRKKMDLTVRKVKVNLKTEEQKKPKVFEYVCELCKSKFKYKERYEAHRLEHQGQTVNKTCTICKKVFMTWSGLQRHTDAEHRAVRLAALRCRTCGKVFRTTHTLRLHARLHTTAPRAVVCHVCGKTYSSPVTLRLHMESHNENRSREHPCSHCGKKFFTKHILHSHVKRLHSGQRYICSLCDYPFTDKYNLSKHVLKIHQGIKEHKCEICDKFFSTHSTLVIHKRIHSGERPYSCSYCSKAFSSKNRQIVHQRTHTGERPHRCSVCSLAFTQLGTMKRHMKTHDKMPPLPSGVVYEKHPVQSICPIQPPDCLSLA